MKRFRFLATVLAATLLSVIGSWSASGQSSSSPQMGLPGTTQRWMNTGPDGGDARSFAMYPSDPKSLYLGTSDGWVYHSSNGGGTWKRLARVGDRDDLVIDNLLLDAAKPSRILAAAWVVNEADGGLYESNDNGVKWTHIAGMDGQSIRALAQAPSDPKIFVAGTLKGVYRSTDGGENWTLISPEGSKEMHEFESIAIDPKDPNVIYAGTWHLPWKTTDGGKSWNNIKQGLIDDSDVFSIIIDPAMPSTTYLSACSGIYKSTDAGAVFHKVQGIPATARRTRVLMQDPTHHNIVYAGTTQGLYRTTDDGKVWSRMTGDDVIVNDVYVDPTNSSRVLLATDRSGVLTSDDNAVTFKSTNAGFSQRQVATLLIDPDNAKNIYVGVLNDKTYGGVFASDDGGMTWAQRSEGLGGRDVYALIKAPGGELIAGTNSGIFALAGTKWNVDGKTIEHAEKKVTHIVKKKRVVETKHITVAGKELKARVSGLAASGDHLYAATDNGVYVSTDKGSTWEQKILPSNADPHFIESVGSDVLAATFTKVFASHDAGVTWQAAEMPGKLTGIATMTSARGAGGKPVFYLGGREGIFYSEDAGSSWTLSRLPVADIGSLTYSEKLNRVLVVFRSSTMIYAIDPVAQTWKWWNSGEKLRTLRWTDGRFIGATPYEGIVVSPKDSGGALGLGAGQ